MDTGVHEGETCHRNKCQGTIELMTKHEAIEFCLCDDDEAYVCKACSGPLAQCRACDWSEADENRPFFADFIIDSSNRNVDIITTNGIEFHYPKLN